MTPGGHLPAEPDSHQDSTGLLCPAQDNDALAARHVTDPPGVPSASSREEMKALLPNEAGVRHMHSHVCTLPEAHSRWEEHHAGSQIVPTVPSVL